jgi:hypothetical protein
MPRRSRFQDEIMARVMVNIDTEEEGLFSGCYPTRDWRLGHLAELPRLQAVFDRFKVRPTYQVTTPVILDRVGSGHLERFLSDGRCDIGGHLHPWATEPLGDLPADDAHSMPCMLPAELVREKLATLTRQIRDRFGVQPVAYRSGRYGSSAAHTPLLLEMGYRVETSVCPFVSHEHFGGPDYSDAPLEPYWLGTASMLTPETGGGLLCVPISAGFNRTNFEAAARLYRRLGCVGLRSLRLIGLLYRLRLLRLIRLNPEMTSLDDMISLCRAMVQRGAETFHLTFHSSNIGVAGTPYVPDCGARDAFLERLAGVLDFLVNRQGVRPVTAREYYDMIIHRGAVSAESHLQVEELCEKSAPGTAEPACCA